MPKSVKGGGKEGAKKKIADLPGISLQRAIWRKLEMEAKRLASNDLLLAREDNTPWAKDVTAYRRDVRRVVKSMGLNPDVSSMYCLRHSHITEAVLANNPAPLDGIRSSSTAISN
jgi:hypothetical protein